MRAIEFIKMHGNGNDFVVIDETEKATIKNKASFASEDIANELKHLTGIPIVRDSVDKAIALVQKRVDTGSYGTSEEV